jgi:hypothetical protein
VAEENGAGVSAVRVVTQILCLDVGIRFEYAGDGDLGTAQQVGDILML